MSLPLLWSTACLAPGRPWAACVTASPVDRGGWLPADAPVARRVHATCTAGSRCHCDPRPPSKELSISKARYPKADQACGGALWLLHAPFWTPPILGCWQGEDLLPSRNSEAESCWKQRRATGRGQGAGEACGAGRRGELGLPTPGLAPLLQQDLRGIPFTTSLGAGLAQ